MLEAAARTAVLAAGRLRLPLANRHWHGQTGNWSGVGTGSSIDFHDHRPYLPGDDPRYINWQAYARSGHYSMKLYREEVSPRIDLVLDASGSMFFEEAKRRRSWEILFFCRECALRAGASLRVFAACADETAELQPEPLSRLEVELPDATPHGAPMAGAIPWRPGSLRILVSDLLFAADAQPFLAPLVQGKGRGMLFVPWTLAEEEPDWAGNLSLIDCETGLRRNQYVNPDLLARYRNNYRRHFEEWKREAARHGILFARVQSDSGLVDALHREAGVEAHG